MAPALSRYPLKAAATFPLILTAPSYLALLALLNLPSSRRRIRQWSLKTAVGRAWLELFYRFATWINLQPFYASREKLGERFVLVQPGAVELYRGMLEHDTIKPVSMPAIWFPKQFRREEKNIIVIHFQGGAFVTATDPQETGQLPARIFAEKLGAITFYAQYRLSRSENTRFPAALQDIVTFYHHVLDQGADPNNIILSGDSVGGHLVLAFLRYLEDNKELVALPKPRGAMVWSPWTDVTEEALERYKESPQLRTDFLPLTLIRWGNDAYVPNNPTDETDRYLSPLRHPYRTDVPIFINVGTAELLHSEVMEFSERMTKVPGNQICYHKTENAPHDIIVAGGYTDFVKQAEEAVEIARDFLKVDMSKSS
jgi:acetyl esterase/lipase